MTPEQQLQRRLPHSPGRGERVDAGVGREGLARPRFSAIGVK